MFWVEDPPCHYTAYLYTPMACQQFTEKTTVAAGPMCKIDTDCQENAYCFVDEVHLQNTGNMIFKTKYYVLCNYLIIYLLPGATPQKPLVAL